MKAHEVLWEKSVLVDMVPSDFFVTCSRLLSSPFFFFLPCTLDRNVIFNKICVLNSYCVLTSTIHWDLNKHKLLNNWTCLVDWKYQDWKYQDSSKEAGVATLLPIRLLLCYCSKLKNLSLKIGYPPDWVEKREINSLWSFRPSTDCVEQLLCPPAVVNLKQDNKMRLISAS